MARLAISGFGQVELNNAAFRRDGRIEAQCAPNASDFSNVTIENGMILAIDGKARELKLPTLPSDVPEVYGLVYSAETAYDNRRTGLKDYYFGVDGAEFLPRLGYLAVGDKFTTNCATYSSDWATLASALSAGALYGAVSTDGVIAISGAVPSQGPVLEVVKIHTMPDGQKGIQFKVVKEG